ncbi:MAG: S-layer homology domain-containing protein [Deltaproteobacteria bacterium]
MKRKVISIIVIAAVLLSMTIAIAEVNRADFADIPNNWSKTALEAAISNGLIVGCNGKIMPDLNIKRSEIAAIINRAFGATQKGDISKFTDIPSDSWYANDMAKAVKMQTFVGSNGKMSPDKFITREEAFVVLARSLKLTTTNYASLDKFTDKAEISGWAKSEIAALVQVGYINGCGNKINPAENITRSEFAQVMHNIIKTYINKAGTYTNAVEGNVMINVPDVILKGVSINGDLIIGDGVGTGNVTLDAVKISGRTIIRGGGKNSIHVINGSTITGTVVIDNVNNEVRIVTDQTTTVQKIEVGSQIVLEGSFGEVKMVGEAANSNASIEVKGNIQSLMIETKAEVTVTSGTIAKLDIAKTASGATINAQQGTKIETVIVNAQANISGSGTVTSVQANADGIKVDTAGTKVTVEQGATGVTVGGKEVKEGSATVSTTGSSGSSGSHTSNPLENGYNGNYTISAAGTYGPDSGTATVSGSVYINTAGVILRNLIITSNLVFGADIANGDAYITSVTVQGRTVVNGGGSNSIHIQGTSTLGIVTVDDQRNSQSEPINISAEGTGTITAVNVTSQSPVKVTAVTDTIGFVAAVDGSIITYADTSCKQALLDKILSNANAVLDASILGSTDATIYLNPELAELTEGIVDVSGEYGIWGLKYYINPLDGVDGYQDEYNALEQKLQSKGLDTDIIKLRQNPGSFTATMYDRWFPGQPGTPCLNLNQGMLNGLWDTLNRYITLKKYKINGSEQVEADIGNTDDAQTVTDFVYSAQSLYDNLELLQNYSVVNDVYIVDTNAVGPTAGDKIVTIFTRRLKSGDINAGKDKIASLITGDARFGASPTVVWSDNTMLDFYGEQFAVTKCEITLGTAPDANLFNDILIIPKTQLGSYVPNGFVEVGGQYGAYITNLSPIFDITVSFN